MAVGDCEQVVVESESRSVLLADITGDGFFLFFFFIDCSAKTGTSTVASDGLGIRELSITRVPSGCSTRDAAPLLCLKLSLSIYGRGDCVTVASLLLVSLRS